MDNKCKYPYMDVVEHVKSYLEEHLPQYDLLEVRRKSIFPADDYLYMVIARDKDGTYALWTSWNESTQSLNHGHYNLESMEECEQIYKENFNKG